MCKMKFLYKKFLDFLFVAQSSKMVVHIRKVICLFQFWFNRFVTHSSGIFFLLGIPGFDNDVFDSRRDSLGPLQRILVSEIILKTWLRHFETLVKSLCNWFIPVHWKFILEVSVLVSEIQFMNLTPTLADGIFEDCRPFCYPFCEKLCAESAGHFSLLSSISFLHILLKSEFLKKNSRPEKKFKDSY